MNPPSPIAEVEPIPAGSFRTAAATILGGSLFVAGYVAVLLWFYGVDVYHRHFSEAGPLVLGHNMCRVAFIFYLFWIVHSAGALLLRLTAGSAIDRLALLERLALCFFAGTGVWHVVLLALGYLNVYTRLALAALTLPFVALAYQDARSCAFAAKTRLCTWAAGMSRGGRWRTAIGGRAGAAVLGGALFVAVLMIKGLYPGGGHDYFTHYFYYDQAVVKQGGLWPNEVWYHYYYSKGAGLFFLAIVLTDPLAPQLVSFCFYAAQLAVLVLLLRRIAPDTEWWRAGLVLFLGLYLYTPGPGYSRSYGGWGDFEKLHELNSALILATLFLAAGAFERTARDARAWTVATVSAVTAAVIINNTVAVYLCAIFGLLFIWGALRRDRQQAALCVLFGAAAATPVIVISAINYLTTGLVNEHDIRLFWPFADVEQLYRWGALPLAILKYWGDFGMEAAGRGVLPAVVLLAKTLRLDLFGPLLAAGLTVAVLSVRTRQWTIHAPRHVLTLSAAAAAAVALALAVGTREAISFYRYTSFMLPIVLLLGVFLCAVPSWYAGGPILSRVRESRVMGAIVGACFVSAVISYHPRRAPIDAVIDATRFAVGGYSIDTAYTTQRGWPARPPYGAIYPGSRGAYAVAGPHTRIWSMHTFSYCMLPDCRMETWPSFIMTPDWDRVMFGTPEEGRGALQDARLDYFLFSTELYLQDPLPLSPLFAPATIARYLGIRWTDGTTSLLTWLGPGVTPLDEEWLARYRRAVAGSPAIQSFPMEPLRAIYSRLGATPHPWTTFPLSSPH